MTENSKPAPQTAAIPETTQHHQPVRPPANQDLHFIIKESLRLGFRFLVEIERALKKLNS
jgi:hypothetical protein